MKLRGLFFASAVIFTMPVFAQTGRQVTGLVKDAAGTALQGATVRLHTGKDSSVVVTNAAGRFTFSVVPANQFSLLVSSLGFQRVKRRYSLSPGSAAAELEPIILNNDTIELKGINVVGVIAMKIKEDTVEYNAAAYKVQEGAAVEDAIRKMPGLEVSRDGSITTQGKQVSRVQLNGKDYMAGDVRSLTRNLPANLVQNVQVIDDYGDQARITGVKTGEAQKVLNINIKKEKNYGYFAQGAVGSGHDVIPEQAQIKGTGRYVGSTNVFHFHGKRQLTLSGDLNNTNTSLLDLNGEGRKGPPDLFGGKQNGVTAAGALGFNYRDDWGKKLVVYGSYGFSNKKVYTRSRNVRNNLSGQLPSIQNSSTTRNEEVLNHRFNFNIEYKPDTLNYFKFSPVYSYAGVGADERFASSLQALNDDPTVISAYTGSLQAQSSTPNFGLMVLYNHRFHKRGRNFSVLLTGGTTPGSEYQNPVYDYLAGSAGAPVNQMIYAGNRTDSGSVNLSYLEPIGKKSFLEFNYNFRKARTTADRLTDTVTNLGGTYRDPDLSTDYKFSFGNSRFGINYKLAAGKYNFTLGLVAQPALLKGSSSVIRPTHQATFNFSPVVRYVYNFNDLQALAFNYQGNGSSPVYHQLQPVIDFSNANYPMQGNAQLLPEYHNSFQLRYNKFGNGTGRTFFSTLNFTQTDHKIVANTVNYPDSYRIDPRLAGKILTKYQNASGFYSAAAYYVLAGAWASRKYTWFLNGNVTYNNNISYLTDVFDALGKDQIIQKNTAKNLVIAQGARLRADIADRIDAEISANYLISHSGNSITKTNLNTNFQTVTLGANGKLYFVKDWMLSYAYSKAFYEGYQGATNPNLLDAYIERRFLKHNMAVLRFSVYDLFNENTGFTAMQNAYAITQSSVNRLGRYFLLTFTLKLQKFAGKLPGSMPGQQRNGG